MKLKISQKKLRRIFAYSEDEGKLYFINKDGSTTRRAGWQMDKNKKYHRIQLGDHRYYEHRLIWMWHYGDIPDHLQIDHINRNRTDNRIENLRLVSQTENNLNAGKNNIYKTKHNTFEVFITVKGKRYGIGTYKTKCGAILARDMWKLKNLILNREEFLYG